MESVFSYEHPNDPDSDSDTMVTSGPFNFIEPIRMQLAFNEAHHLGILMSDPLVPDGPRKLPPLKFTHVSISVPRSAGVHETVPPTVTLSSLTQ